MPWIDYSMFKQLMILSHLVPCKELTDEVIDKVYGKYTAFEKVANQNPITEERFVGVLQKVGQLKYPYDPPDEVVGRVIKYWLFPYLLWYVQPLHGQYPHEVTHTARTLSHLRAPHRSTQKHTQIAEIQTRIHANTRKYVETHANTHKYKQKHMHMQTKLRTARSAWGGAIKERGAERGSWKVSPPPLSAEN